MTKIVIVLAYNFGFVSCPFWILSLCFLYYPLNSDFFFISFCIVWLVCDLATMCISIKPNLIDIPEDRFLQFYLLNVLNIYAYLYANSI